MSTNIKPLVSINCLVYNHEPYLRDCFEGFVKQKTSFPIEILVHDDASTDHSADIIREYTAKYPDLFKPIYQIENQYSKGVKISFEYQYPRAQGKYIALCEGDDYWTDPSKLQMQVDWLETHPDYTMCCSDAVIESPDGILDWHRYEDNCDIPVKDMISGSGNFVQTATLVYLKSLLDNYPEICKKCHVGDYPLQIWAILNGKIHYFAKKTATYRFMNHGSWTNKTSQLPIESQLKGYQTELDMLEGLNTFSKKKFTFFFLTRESRYIYNFARAHRKQSKKILKHFHSYEKHFTLQQKIEGFLIRLKLWPLIDPYLLIAGKRYKEALLSTPFTKRIILFIYYNILRNKK